MLVILDVVFVNVSSFLALWVRFNMHMSEIPGYYMDSVWDLVIINTVFTVIVYLHLPSVFQSVEICQHQRAGLHSGSLRDLRPV